MFVNSAHLTGYKTSIASSTTLSLTGCRSTSLRRVDKESRLADRSVEFQRYPERPQRAAISTLGKRTPVVVSVSPNSSGCPYQSLNAVISTQALDVLGEDWVSLRHCEGRSIISRRRLLVARKSSCRHTHRVVNICRHREAERIILNHTFFLLPAFAAHGGESLVFCVIIARVWNCQTGRISPCRRTSSRRKKTGNDGSPKRNWPPPRSEPKSRQRPTVPRRLRKPRRCSRRR